MRKLVYAIVILICVLLGVSFATLNAEPVRVDFYLLVRDVPLSLLLMVTLLIGALLGTLASLGWGVRARIEAGRLRRIERTRSLATTVQEP
ncbi:MAG: LapA family protein [Gammaproteobacteria bacterium]|nr:LapA family protein [Gammaproteobacteria bacterium]MCP5135856.1 LapA family protein [Gammaproteobacteria bacterium]